MSALQQSAEKWS